MPRIETWEVVASFLTSDVIWARLSAATVSAPPASISESSTMASVRDALRWPKALAISLLPRIASTPLKRKFVPFQPMVLNAIVTPATSPPVVPAALLVSASIEE